MLNLTAVIEDSYSFIVITFRLDSFHRILSLFSLTDWQEFIIVCVSK